MVTIKEIADRGLLVGSKLEITLFKDVTLKEPGRLSERPLIDGAGLDVKGYCRTEHATSDEGERVIGYLFYLEGNKIYLGRKFPPKEPSHEDSFFVEDQAIHSYNRLIKDSVLAEIEDMSIELRDMAINPE